MFQIETGIPITRLKSNRMGGKYPFAKMDVNQSFFVPMNSPYVSAKTLVQLQTNLYNAAKSWSKTNTKGKYTFATSQMKRENGIRIWRTK